MSPIRWTILCTLLLVAPADAQDGWHYFRGDLQRSGAASKAKPWEKRVAWQRPLLCDTLEGFDDPDPENITKALIETLRKDSDPTVLPGSFPIIVGNLCHYRSYQGIVSVTVQPTSVVDEESGDKREFKPGEILSKSIPHNRSLVKMIDPYTSFGIVQNAATLAAGATMVKMVQGKTQAAFFWANPLTGTLCSDGKQIYSINDFAFPPMDLDNPRQIPEKFRAIALLWRRNEFGALDADNGKLKWDSYFTDVPTLKESHFLGGPLFHVGRLFALNEAGGVLQLLRIDPAPTMVGNNLSINLEIALAIANIPAREQILMSPLRRTQALHIALAGDTLVCPTHAGTIVGVDRAKMAVRWTYRYRHEQAFAGASAIVSSAGTSPFGTAATWVVASSIAPPPTLPHWQAACPIVAGERIVITAADAPDVHCLDLDGRRRWVARPDGDLYLATVHDDIVLLVGKRFCRALNLIDGKEKWRLDMGLPAGVGVRDGSRYYLPLKQDALTKGPALWAIDLATGKRAERLAVPYPDALGNLALHRGLFVSQSVTHVAAFPLTPAAK